MKNRGLLLTLPAHPSLARSLITISVIHPPDCNLSINPSPCNTPESPECSCLTPVSCSFSDSSSNLHPPLWDCPVSPPPITRLSAPFTPCPCSLALCRPATPRRTPGSPLGFSPPCPGLHPGVCPHPGLERGFVSKYKKEPELKIYKQLNVWNNYLDWRLWTFKKNDSSLCEEPLEISTFLTHFNSWNLSQGGSGEGTDLQRCSSQYYLQQGKKKISNQLNV